MLSDRLAKQMKQLLQLKQQLQLQHKQLSKCVDDMCDQVSDMKLRMILRDESRVELLFKQPESSCYGDCPICSLPLPLDEEKSIMYTCCSKTLCRGCAYASITRDLDKMASHTLQELELWIKNECPFCRQALPKTKEEQDKIRRKRIEANDPVALRQEGRKQYKKGNHAKAFEYYTKAIELGDTETHLMLVHYYIDRKEVEKDGVKIAYHLHEAAIGGHPEARYILGCKLRDNGYHEKAVKLWIIAASQGHDESIKALTKAFKEGSMEKKDLAAALRAQKAAVDATKSKQRTKGEEFFRAQNDASKAGGLQWTL